MGEAVTSERAVKRPLSEMVKDLEGKLIEEVWLDEIHNWLTLRMKSGEGVHTVYSQSTFALAPEQMVKATIGSGSKIYLTANQQRELGLKPGDQVLVGALK